MNEQPSSKVAVEQWITEELGERCATYVPSCVTCFVWKTFDRTEEWSPDEPNADLRAALVHAVSVIQTWRNMDVPAKERSQLWDIYWRNAPEMKQIRAALSEDVTP